MRPGSHDVPRRRRRAELWNPGDNLQGNSQVEAPLYPIIYVRGYAGSEDAMKETVAAPYMRFNLDATRRCQTHDHRTHRHDLESPAARLLKAYEYAEACNDGAEMPPGKPLSPPSVAILPHHDSGTKDDVLFRERWLDPAEIGAVLEFRIPAVQKTRPGIDAAAVLAARKCKERVRPRSTGTDRRVSTDGAASSSWWA